MSDTAEAKNVVGAIGRSATAAQARLSADAQSASTDTRCGTAPYVPRQFVRVRGQKYQSDSSPGQDYQTGDDNEGWRCLRFDVSQPQAYQYRYKRGRAPAAANLPLQSNFGGRRWTALARGDRDNDNIRSWFVLDGVVKDGNTRIATAIAQVNAGE